MCYRKKAPIFDGLFVNKCAKSFQSDLGNIPSGVKGQSDVHASLDAVFTRSTSECFFSCLVFVVLIIQFVQLAAA